MGGDYKLLQDLERNALRVEPYSLSVGLVCVLVFLSDFHSLSIYTELLLSCLTVSIVVICAISFSLFLKLLE